MKKVVLEAIVGLWLAISLPGCGRTTFVAGPKGGALDGTWEITSIKCQGILIESSDSMKSLSITFQNSTASLKIVESDCTVSLSHSVSYMASGKFTLKQIGIFSQSPVGCAASIAEFDQKRPPLQTFNYVLNENSLNLSEEGASFCTQRGSSGSVQLIATKYN